MELLEPAEVALVHSLVKPTQVLAGEKTAGKDVSWCTALPPERAIKLQRRERPEKNSRYMVPFTNRILVQKSNLTSYCRLENPKYLYRI